MSRTTPLTWSSTTQLSTMPCISPTRWVTPWPMFPRRPCYWPAPAQMSLQGKKTNKPCQHFNFSVLLCGFIFLFDSFSPSARFNASTSRRGTLTRSGWSTCPRARTQRHFVWARAGWRSPPAHWCSASSLWAESRGKSSVCPGRWCAWWDTESSCSLSTTGVRHTHTHTRLFLFVRTYTDFSSFPFFCTAFPCLWTQVFTVKFTDTVVRTGHNILTFEQMSSLCWLKMYSDHDNAVFTRTHVFFLLVSFSLIRVIIQKFKYRYF